MAEMGSLGGAFSILWEGWISFLVWIGGSSMSVSPVQVTVVSIVLGVVLFLVLENIVFKRLLKGGESSYGSEKDNISRGASVIISVAIIIFAIYSGIIEVVIAVFWFFLMAMVLVLIYILYVSGRSIIGPFQGLNSELRKESAERRKIDLESKKSLRDIVETEKLDKKLANETKGLMKLIESIEVGQIKFLKLLQTTEKALRSFPRYANLGEAQFSQFKNYLGVLANQMIVEEKWLETMKIKADGVTRDVIKQKGAIDIHVKKLEADITLIEKTALQQVKLLALNAVDIKKLENINIAAFKSHAQLHKSGAAPTDAKDIAILDKIEKKRIEEIAKLKALLTRIERIKMQLKATKTLFNNYETKLVAYEQQEEAERERIRAYVTQLQALIRGIIANPNDANALNTAIQLTDRLIRHESIEIKTDRKIEAIVVGINNLLKRLDTLMLELAAEIKKLEYIEALDKSITNIEAKELVKLKTTFKENLPSKSRFRRK